MNIHHLELFYYVAKHGGIHEAVRHMPYGIQQPAVSSQLIQLEESLGLSLFQRRPFLLSPAGLELYGFIRPFFDQLIPMGDKLRGGISQHIRIGASQIVLRDYLPDALEAIRQKFPKFKLTLREGYQPELDRWLREGELDLTLTLLDENPPGGARARRLFDLPLILLAPKKSKLASAEELFARDKIDEPLISLPAHEAITKVFQQTLGRRGIDWFTGIEVSSLNLVEEYTARGYGLGLSVRIPKRPIGPGLRALELSGFPPVRFGALWHGRATPIVSAFLEIIEQNARSLIESSGTARPLLTRK